MQVLKAWFLCISIIDMKVKASLLLIIPGILCFVQGANAQQLNIPKKEDFRFGGGASVTNNGISLLPTFTLGKPAAIFDLNLAGKRFSFEPQFRFALEGKPWSMIFWWRYKVVHSSKFQLKVGAHPAIAFRKTNVLLNNRPREVLLPQRYLASEISPNYMLSKGTSIGTYLLYSRGLEPEAVRNTLFITLNANFSNIRLGKGFVFKINPQVYRLKMDQQSGYYVTSTFTLVKEGSPFSLSSIVNKTIKTSIVGSKDLIYNLSINYSFNRKFMDMRTLGL